jgi:tRNA/tmRNA/rRNA uracil-C5-methylase (TrmA/RlmC/RlmD family)
MKSKKALALTVFCLFTTGAVFAKLPAPSEEQKAKAVEAKAKAGEAAKKEAELLANSQDRVADRYIKAQKAKGVAVKPTPIAAAAPAAPAPAAKK